MTEFEKMRSSQLYNFNDPEVLGSISHANKLCAKLQTMTTQDEDYRRVIEELIPGCPASTTVNTPFHCDHGNGIRLGENVFINYNATFLDGGLVTIGARTKVGPNCQFLTPNHPMDYTDRRLPQETCFPITVGEDCWLAAGVTVCPGVTIGARTVVAAGSVVTKDLPSDVLAAGCPAEVKRKLRGKE